MIEDIEDTDILEAKFQKRLKFVMIAFSLIWIALILYLDTIMINGSIAGFLFGKVYLAY